LVALIAVAVVVCFFVRWYATLGGGSADADTLSAYSAAYLKGGYARMAEAAMAKLHRAGAIGFTKPRRLFPKERPEQMDALEEAIWNIAAAKGSVDDARRSVKYVGSADVDELVDRGLAMSRGRKLLWRGASVTPLLLLAAAAGLRVKVGLDRDEEVLAVVLFGAALLLASLILMGVGLRTTAAGRRALRAQRRNHRRIRRSQDESPADWAWACGLYGFMSLPEPQAKGMQAALRPGNGGSDDSGGDSGCSGCSGCGGCGRCGD